MDACENVDGSDEDVDLTDCENDVSAEENRFQRESDEEGSRIALLEMIDSLRSASTDTQKFTFLLILAKLLNQTSRTLPSDLRRNIFEAVGATFLIRLLKTSEPTAGCPPRMYQSIAVTIIRCLCADPVVAAEQGMLEATPCIVDIVMEGAYAERDTDLTLIQDAYECLILIAMHPSGARILVEADTVKKLVSIIMEERFNHEQAIQVILRLVSVMGSDVWQKNFLIYLSLVERLSQDFEKDHSKGKAQACDVMTRLLFAAPKNMIPLKGSNWVMNLQKGVADILASRVNKELRDAALHLSAAVTMSVDPKFWLRSPGPENSSAARDRFLVVLIRMVVVELHLLLEDTSWQTVLAEQELLGSCLIVLENMMTACYSGKLHLLGEEDRTILYQDTSEGTEIVVNFVESFLNARVKADDESVQLTCEEIEVFTATMRVLAARLMEDPDAFGDKALTVLPMVCALLEKQGSSSLHSLWDILLPAFVVFSAEDKTRKVLIDTGIPIMLFDRFETLRVEFLSKLKSVGGGRLMLDGEVNALKLILNLLLNVLVSEREVVRRIGRGYSKFWRPVFETLLELGSLPEYLPLVGHLVVSGLMLTRVFPEFQETMGGVGCRYLSATVRFLWDAFNIEESADGQTLDVSFGYKPIWEEVKDLWFIGMDCVTKLAETNRTIADFIVLVDWPAEIVRSLAKSNPILPHISTVFEAFLLTVAKRSKAAEGAMKEFGPHKFCDPHGMSMLKNYLVPFGPPTPTP